MSNHNSADAREMATYRLNLKNVEDEVPFYSPITKRLVAFVMDGDKRRLFECFENVQEHHPQYKNLGIFGTKFGSTLNDFLLNECPDISILDDIIDLQGPGDENENEKEKRSGEMKVRKLDFNSCSVSFKEKRIIAFGAVQAGKTNFMITTAILYQMFGISSLIMLRDISIDRVQLHNRIEKTAERFKSFSEARGLVSADHHFNIECIDEMKDLENVLKSSPASICICISNESTMKKIYDQLTGNEKYVLFIDEVDLVDSTTAVIRYPHMNNIKEKAKLVIGVSASILGTAVEWNINPTCIRELKKPANYIGLNKIQAIELDTGDNTVVKGDDMVEIYKSVPGLRNHIKHFSECGNKTITGTVRPEIELIRISTEIAPQKALRDEIMSTYPTIATMLCVENGIDITHPSLGNKSITTLDNKYKSKVSKGVHHFTNDVDVGSAMAIFQNKGIDHITHIICIAGKKASRSVSFSSNIKGIDRWYVTKMLIKFSKTTTFDDIMQIAGRVCGVFLIGTTQCIYASIADLETIKKAYFSQEELLNNTSRKYGKMIEAIVGGRMVNIWKRNDVPIPLNTGMDELLNKIKMSYWKLTVPRKTPTGRSSQTIKRLTMRDVLKPEMVDDDGRDSKDEYNFENAQIVEEKCIDNGEEFVRLHTMFRQWSTRETKISKFMQHLDPRKTYSKDEMTSLCEEHGIDNKSHLTVKGRGLGSNGYGKIMEKINDTYRLYPQLIEEFEKYF